MSKRSSRKTEEKRLVVSQKDCTKKEWKEKMKARRSQVGIHQNLGTRTHEESYKTERVKGKKEIRQAMQGGATNYRGALALSALFLSTCEQSQNVNF